MKLKIEYKDKQKFGKEDLLLMKQFIDSKKISGLKKIELEKGKIKKGEMGAGIGGALIGLVGSLVDPLTTLCSAVVEWVKLHRSDVKLRLDNGEELVISANLCRSKKAINEIVETFVNKTIEIRQKAPGTKKDKPLPPPPSHGQSKPEEQSKEQPKEQPKEH